MSTTCRKQPDRQSPKETPKMVPTWPQEAPKAASQVFILKRPQDEHQRWPQQIPKTVPRWTQGVPKMNTKDGPNSSPRVKAYKGKKGKMEKGKKGKTGKGKRQKGEQGIFLAKLCLLDSYSACLMVGSRRGRPSVPRADQFFFHTTFLPFLH